MNTQPAFLRDDQELSELEKSMWVKIFTRCDYGTKEAAISPGRLSEAFMVSLGGIRKAVENLRNLGYLRVKRGSGLLTPDRYICTRPVFVKFDTKTGDWS